jgi:hypothetical protein
MKKLIIVVLLLFVGCLHNNNHYVYEVYQEGKVIDKICISGYYPHSDGGVYYKPKKIRCKCDKYQCPLD